MWVFQEVDIWHGSHLQCATSQSRCDNKCKSVPAQATAHPQTVCRPDSVAKQVLLRVAEFRG